MITPEIVPDDHNHHHNHARKIIMLFIIFIMMVMLITYNKTEQPDSNSGDGNDKPTEFSKDASYSN